MLDLAKRLWEEILTELAEDIELGTPLVGLEPSCVAAFRDELVQLFPEDARARRLSQQTYTLAEFLDKVVEDYRPPHLDQRALLHGHCHQKAILGMDSDRRLLAEMGVAYEQPETGCCGMAGAFGYEKHKYPVAVAAGERVLLPAVREAAASTLIVTDGFSCREQIRQHTQRRALHLAEVLQLAYQQSARPKPAAAEPERLAARNQPSALTRARPSAPIWIGAFLGGGILAYGLLRGLAHAQRGEKLRGGWPASARRREGLYETPHTVTAPR